MGFYASPIGNEIATELKPGYIPPDNGQVTRVLSDDGEYAWRPNKGASDALLLDGYIAPSAQAVSRVLLRDKSSDTGKSLFPAGIQSSLSFGLAVIKRKSEFVAPNSIASSARVGAAAIRLGSRKIHGFDSASVLAALDGGYVAPGAAATISAVLRMRNEQARTGFPAVESSNRRVIAQGFASAAYGLPFVGNLAASVNPHGWVDDRIGLAYTWNLSQYSEVQGIGAPAFSHKPYVGFTPPGVPTNYFLVSLSGAFADDIGIDVAVTTLTDEGIEFFYRGQYYSKPEDGSLEGVARSLAAYISENFTGVKALPFGKGVYVWLANSGPLLVDANIFNEGCDVLVTVTQTAAPKRDGNRPLLYVCDPSILQYTIYMDSDGFIGFARYFWDRITSTPSGSVLRLHLRRREDYEVSEVITATYPGDYFGFGQSGRIDALAETIKATLLSYNSGKEERDKIGFKVIGPNMAPVANDVVVAGDIVGSSPNRFSVRKELLPTVPSHLETEHHSNFVFSFPTGSETERGNGSSGNGWDIFYTVQSPGEVEIVRAPVYSMEDEKVVDNGNWPIPTPKNYISRVNADRPQITKVEVVGERVRPAADWFAAIGGTQAAYTSKLGDTLSDVAQELANDFAQNLGFAVSAVADVVFTVTSQPTAEHAVSGGSTWPSPIIIGVTRPRQFIKPDGSHSQNAVGQPERVWNFHSFLKLAGYDTQRFGEPFASGGVKYVSPSGIGSLAFGAIKVINTRADQYANPDGIKPPDIPRPAVSPQILRAVGVLGTVFGSTLVQFPPRPTGWLSQAFGYPAVDFKTKRLGAKGFGAFETGYPRVRDRAQKVWPSSVAVSDVFGDVAASLRTLKIQVPGLYAHESNPWAVLRNVRRVVEVRGVDALAMGQSEIRNKSPNLTPGGFDSQHFGATDVSGWLKRIAPKGVPGPFDAFPPPVVSQTPSFAPTGIGAPATGQPTVWLRHRTFDIGSFVTLRMGEPGVDFRWRKVVLQGAGIAGAAYGNARIEHSYRALSPVSWTHEAFGDSWLSFRRRYLEPRGIEPVEMSRHQIGGTRYIGPVGFEATRWLTRIVPEAQEIFPKTMLAAYGWPTVSLKRRYLQPMGFATDTDYRDRWGLANAWNLRQYIIQEENAESLLSPPKFSPWLKLENRNKTIGAIGYIATLYGRAQVDNKARLLVPSGIAAPLLPEYQKTGSVTHRVRPLALDGLEPPIMSRWAVVWNKAFPLRPAGLVATQFGNAQLANTRRYRNVQGFSAQAMGFPFVAYAIRKLTFESRYGIAPLRMDLPDVRLNTRYVDVPGMDGSVRGQSKLGLPIVVTHFNKIVPRWTHQERAGSPIVRNLTPELRPRNWLDAEFGESSVRLQWRPVKPDGSNMALFGHARIADSRQTVVAPGWGGVRFGEKMTVRRTGLDPVITQFIDLRRFVTDEYGNQVESGTGYGIAPPEPTQLGVPDFLKGYVYPMSRGGDGDMLGMGNPAITANTIRVEPGYWDLLVGEPAVSLKIRRVGVAGIGPLVKNAVDILNMGSWGLPRLSPHTIYAVEEAPEQAVRNHALPLTSIRPVNSGIACGTPTVSTYLGLLQHFASYRGGHGSEFMGAAVVFNMDQHISVKGWNSMRLGLLKIPGAQTIEHENDIAEGAVGNPTVARPPYTGPVEIGATGLLSGVCGAPFVSLFHRTVYPQGHLMEDMGNSFRNALVINMPGGLHVGPPNLHQQVGFDACSAGEPWISHRVRELRGEGWDAFVCEYDYQNFDKRMRVRRTGQSSQPWKVIGVRGFVGTAYGTPDAKPGTQYIRPDGNTMNHRQGAQNAH